MYIEFVSLREGIESLLRNLADGGALLFKIHLQGESWRVRLL